MLREVVQRSRPSVAARGRRAVGRTQAAVKRLYDVVVALVALIVFLPLFFVVALAIRIESAGPAFFRQERVGFRGVTFKLWKFRTMIDGADEQKDTLRSANEADGHLFKIRDDPRLTRVGRILRRSSLDELPQLLNVMAGDMSLVGPRPLPACDYDFEHEGMVTRLNVRPGLTGLWQVNGRVQTTSELVHFDSAYVANSSLLLDIVILLRTIPAILTGRGAL